MMSSSASSSGSYGSNNSSKSNISYTACDFGLVMLQRLLICVSVVLGYDLVYAPREFPHMFFLQTLTRIIRNFFYLTKGVRKWLAIHYNEGIIPDPPMRYGRSFRVARSTPVSATSNGFGVSLKQSPIERRYSEPANNFDLATALKEQHNRSEGMETAHRYPDSGNSSDLFGHHSSLSLCFLLNGLAKSFIGCIEDPDEEMNKVELASRIKNAITAGGTNATVESLQSSAQPDLSEIRRRNDEIVESVLVHDAEQEKLANKLNSSTSSFEDKLKPLPILNFDLSMDTRYPSTSMPEGHKKHHQPSATAVTKLVRRILETKLRDNMSFGSANMPVPLNFDAEKEMVDTD